MISFYLVLFYATLIMLSRQVRPGRSRPPQLGQPTCPHWRGPGGAGWGRAASDLGQTVLWQSHGLVPSQCP